MAPSRSNPPIFLPPPRSALETIQIARLSDIVAADQITGRACLKNSVQGLEGEFLKAARNVLRTASIDLLRGLVRRALKGQPMAHEIIVLAGRARFGIAVSEGRPGYGPFGWPRRGKPILFSQAKGWRQ